jgi:hypothetical protein
MRETWLFEEGYRSGRSGVIELGDVQRLVRAWSQRAVLMDWHIALRWAGAAGRREPVLLGVAFNHRAKPDSMYIESGRIQDVNGTRVSTEKSTYELGPINPKFEEHIRRTFGEIDPKRPAGSNMVELIGLAADENVDRESRRMIDVLWPHRPGVE